MRGVESRCGESVAEKKSFRNSPSRLVRAISVISFGSSTLPVAPASGGCVLAESTSTGSLELERSKMRRLTSSNTGLGALAAALEDDLAADDLIGAPASFVEAFAGGCTSDAARSSILLREMASSPGFKS